MAEYTEYKGSKYRKDKVWFIRSAEDVLFCQVVSPVAFRHVFGGHRYYNCRDECGKEPCDHGSDS